MVSVAYAHRRRGLLRFSVRRHGLGGDAISRMKVGVADLDGSDFTKAVLERSQCQDRRSKSETLPERRGRNWCAPENCAPPWCSRPDSRPPRLGACSGARTDAGRQLLYDPSQSMVRPMVAGIAHPARHAAAVAAELHRRRQDPCPSTLDNVAVTHRPPLQLLRTFFRRHEHAVHSVHGHRCRRGLLLMRQQGIWRRLRAAPLSRTVLLGSRVAGTA